LHFQHFSLNADPVARAVPAAPFLSHPDYDVFYVPVVIKATPRMAFWGPMETVGLDKKLSDLVVILILCPTVERPAKYQLLNAVESPKVQMRLMKLDARRLSSPQD
jgi:hypothetical protein